MTEGRHSRATAAILLSWSLLHCLPTHEVRAGATQEPIALSAEKAASWKLLDAAVTGEAVLAARKRLFGIPDYEDWRASVSGIRQIDANGDGKNDIVAGFDLRTSKDPVELLTMMSFGENYVVQLFSAEYLSMDTSFLDIEGDGRYELLLKSLLPEKVPLNEATYWVDVYSWENGRYRMNSPAFVETYYLRQYLNYLASRIKRATQLLAVAESPDAPGVKPSEVAVGILQSCRTALERMAELRH